MNSGFMVKDTLKSTECFGCFKGTCLATWNLTKKIFQNMILA